MFACVCVCMCVCVCVSDGLNDVETVLRIGFLNDKLLERREEYLALFDVVLVNDGPMSAFDDLLAPIFQ